MYNLVDFLAGFVAITISVNLPVNIFGGMKTIRISLFVSALIVLAACGSSKKAGESTPLGNWQSGTVTVDGNDEEWKKPMIYNDKREMLYYSITNDSTNVYICLKASNEQLQVKILQSGLKVWLDANGQKKETLGIHFPMGGNTNNAMPSSMNAGQGTDMTKIKAAALGRQKEYELIGFGAVNNKYAYKSANPVGIDVRIGFNNFQELVYEASIPLAAIYDTRALSDKPGPATIAVGFFSKGLPEPAMPSGGQGGMSGPPPGGMGAPPGGGPGGGMGGNNQMSDMQKMFKDTKVWKVLPVAVPPAK